MRAALLLALFLSWIAPAAAQAPPPRLIADLSQSRIDIVYTFAGAEILVFGVIQYPGGASPDERPDLAVIVRGPPEAITVRRKSRVLGLWLNTEAVRFETAPGFYAAATTAPIEDLVDEQTAAIYELGISHLQLSPTSAAGADHIRAFENGFLTTRRSERLYAEQPGAVEFTENILYRARVDLPSSVPIGTYTVEIHLIENGDVTATTTRTIEIEKSGFEQEVYVASQERGFTYGGLAVSLALLLGWSASVLTRR